MAKLIGCHHTFQFTAFRRKANKWLKCFSIAIPSTQITWGVKKFVESPPQFAHFFVTQTFDKWNFVLIRQVVSVIPNISTEVQFLPFPMSEGLSRWWGKPWPKPGTKFRPAPTACYPSQTRSQHSEIGNIYFELNELEECSRSILPFPFYVPGLVPSSPRILRLVF